MQNLNYLSEDDDFVHPYSLHIGKFYFRETKCRFGPFGISRKYYEEGTDIKDWVNFFSKIGTQNSCDTVTCIRIYVHTTKT